MELVDNHYAELWKNKQIYCVTKGTRGSARQKTLELWEEWKKQQEVNE